MTEQENEILNAEGLVDSGVSGAAKSKSSVDYLFHASAEDFKKIPGSPIAYWIGKNLINVFGDAKKNAGDISNPNQALVTGNTELYIRKFWEISYDKVGFGILSRDESNNSRKKWFPYNKGGDFRNWYGNHEHVINWENDGFQLQTTLHPSGKRVWAHNFVLDSIFKEALVWSKITSGKPCFRYSPEGFLFDDASGVCTFEKGQGMKLLGIFCSKVNLAFQKLINPTLNIQPDNLRNVPLPNNENNLYELPVKELIHKSKSDWNTFETSWDFTSNPLIQLHTENPSQPLAENYQAWWDSNQATIAEMQHLEEENNRLFIEAYGLQDELTPDVPLEEITLTVNPKYRYGGKASDDELAARFQSDTMAELISYAVGCMFGRYSLNQPGLVLASQGETLDDYLAQIPEPSFMPDDDNVIPMIDFDGDWFEDDISERFKQFLRVSFGEANYAANLAFIEQSLGKDIRKYFLKDFYKDHVQRYKKRPIYWLFSSPKGTFNALIYLHRYRSDTVSVVLNEYLREFRTKLQARKEYFEQINISASSSQKEKTQALKTIDKINKALDEVNSYERDVLYPLAGEQIEIDLDDGVKVNYPKFGTALKKVAGLS